MNRSLASIGGFRAGSGAKYGACLSSVGALRAGRIKKRVDSKVVYDVVSKAFVYAKQAEEEEDRGDKATRFFVYGEFDTRSRGAGKGKGACRRGRRRKRKRKRPRGVGRRCVGYCGFLE